ncbi:MAG: response regulator [Chthoniobacterales bacterium]
MVADITEPLSDAVERASELRNLLQIIGGTTDLLENIWAGNDESGKYLEMLRTSVDRAAQLTIGLVEAAGCAADNVVVTSSRPTEPVLATLPSVAREKPRVLVVDDEPMMRSVFEELLGAHNYDVITAGSGCEALDVLGRDANACDLMLLDFAMPFMKGDEVFRRVRAICPTLPVILAAGFVHRQTLEPMLEAGLTAFVSKPVAPDELLGVLAQVLSDETEPSASRGTAAAR